MARFVWTLAALTLAVAVPDSTRAATPGSVAADSAPGPAAAQATTGAQKPDADELAKRVDAAMRPAKDATFTVAVTVRHADGAEVTRKLRIWQRGADQRMVKFLAPARLRGTGVLAPDQERVLVYLPAYRRVREITGRDGGDAFLGTGFSVDELALQRLAPDHHVKIVDDAPERWTLSYTAHDPADVEYRELLAIVRKSDHIATELRYVDAAGEVYRTMTLSDFRRVGDYTVAHRFQVVSAKDSKTTTAAVETAEFDKGLDASLFTETNLKRKPR